MRRVLVAAMVSVFMVMVMSGCAHESKMEESTAYPAVVKERVAVMTATVAAIDLEKRVVTLQNQEGDVRDFRVGEEVVNLPQVKVGDIVTIKFFESIAVEIVKPGATTGAGENTTIVRAKPGEMPGRMITHQQKVLATVKAIDKVEGTISLTGPAGKTVRVKVENPENLGKVNVGDELLITFTEAQAIFVEHAR